MNNGCVSGMIKSKGPIFTLVSKAPIISGKGDVVTMDIQYREAQKEDCPVIAEYIYRASDGLLDYLFEGIIPGMTVIQLLTHGLEDEARYNSYRGALVAEYNHNLVGLIQTYPSMYHRIDDEMKAFIPGERLEKLIEFYCSGINSSLVINAMFVAEKFRCRGIGTALISLAKTKAKSMGFRKLSLFVLADNITAQNVYSSNGFTMIKEIGFQDGAKINHEGGFYSMACDI